MEAEPRSVRARVVLATVAGKTGRIPQAIGLLHEAMGIEPANRIVLDRLCNLLRHVGRVQDAVEIAQEAIYHHPEDAVGYNNLGRCLMARQELAAAQEQFQKATSHDPQNALYRYNLGEAHYLQGRNADALTEFRKATELNPAMEQAWLRVAKLLVHHGDREGAVKACERAESIPEAHVVWAEALQELGRRDEADQHLRRASELDPQGAVSLGYRLQVLGRFDEAEAAFRRAIDSNPRLSRAYAGLVHGRRVTEEDALMLESMRLLVADPTLPPADKVVLHFALGKAHEDLGNYGRAMMHFHEANGTARTISNMGFDGKYLASVNDGRIASFSREAIAELAKDGSHSDTPLFVIGMIRSGTTLVEQALSSHPQIGAGGELRYWYENQERRDVGAMAEKYLILLRQIGGEGKNRIIDKMPLNFAFLGLMHAAFPRAKIIHCRREPIDNCLSIYTTFFDNPPPFAHDPQNIIFYYRQYERLMKHWRTALPKGSILEVRYEDMVRDREAATRRILEFAEVPWNDAVLRHEKNERAVRTPSLWQVRQPIYTSSVERWRRFEPWLEGFSSLIPKSSEQTDVY